jgi:hypothetical protein
MDIEELKHEWRHHGKPPFNQPVQVWTYSQVRKGSLLEDGYFHLHDCTHSLQNSILSTDAIDAWRLI